MRIYKDSSLYGVLGQKQSAIQSLNGMILPREWTILWQRFSVKQLNPIADNALIPPLRIAPCRALYGFVENYRKTADMVAFFRQSVIMVGNKRNGGYPYV